MRDGWTEVRLRRPALKRNEGGLTSYFVTNIPEATTKEEIRRSFNSFGDIADIFMGLRRGKNGLNYAFVKFRAVEDSKRLEEELKGIRCKGRQLSVNLEKFGRKEATKAYNPSTRQQVREPKVIQQSANVRQGRSFAQVVNPGLTTRQHSGGGRSSPVILHIEQEANIWINRVSLVGEAKSLDHLSHLPSFQASSFLKNNKGWKELFNWVKPAEHAGGSFDRVAWIRLVGMPINLWNQSKFSAIARRYGKVIAPFDDVPNRVDIVGNRGPLQYTHLVQGLGTQQPSH
ncbi:hypothetical protein LXL04_009963 [Taraxacum kok-saghyz]